jgi:hypothetical protein
MKHPAIGWNLTALSLPLPLSKRPVTYLDTNALSDISQLRDPAGQIPGIEQVRRDLCSFASRRTIAVGQWLFSELAFLEDHERRADFLADMAFVGQLQFLQILRPSGDMGRREVKAFLTGGELNPVISTSLHSTIKDRALD